MRNRLRGACIRHNREGLQDGHLYLGSMPQENAPRPQAGSRTRQARCACHQRQGGKIQISAKIRSEGVLHQVWNREWMPRARWDQSQESRWSVARSFLTLYSGFRQLLATVQNCGRQGDRRGKVRQYRNLRFCRHSAAVHGWYLRVPIVHTLSAGNGARIGSLPHDIRPERHIPHCFSPCAVAYRRRKCKRAAAGVVWRFAVVICTNLWRRQPE